MEPNMVTNHRIWLAGISELAMYAETTSLWSLNPVISGNCTFQRNELCFDELEQKTYRTPEEIKTK